MTTRYECTECNSLFADGATRCPNDHEIHRTGREVLTRDTRHTSATALGRTEQDLEVAPPEVAPAPPEVPGGDGPTREVVVGDAGQQAAPPPRPTPSTEVPSHQGRRSGPIEPAPVAPPPLPVDSTPRPTPVPRERWWRRWLRRVGPVARRVVMGLAMVWLFRICMRAARSGSLPSLRTLFGGTAAVLLSVLLGVMVIVPGARERVIEWCCVPPPKPLPLQPSAAVTDNQLPGATVDRLIDRNIASFWGARPGGKPIRLRVTFPADVDVKQVSVAVGDGDRRFGVLARPRGITVLGLDDAGRPLPRADKHVELADQADDQLVTLSLKGVRSLEMIIETYYGDAQSADLAVADMRFFGFSEAR